MKKVKEGADSKCAEFVEIFFYLLPGHAGSGFAHALSHAFIELSGFHLLGFAFGMRIGLAAVILQYSRESAESELQG